MEPPRLGAVRVRMNTQFTMVTGALAAAFALIHIYIRRLKFLAGVPRNRWLSFAGGVAVGYIFLHILPELGSHADSFARGLGMEPPIAETLAYGVALLGLASFYGVERAVKISRARSRERGHGDQVEQSMLWLHIGSFSALNVLIGYLLLHREEGGWWALALYFVAMSLHFVTNDFGMREDHAEAYDRTGRWIIAGAVLAGWVLGLLVTVPPVAIGFLFGFLAGGIVLNVLKEELPQERESRFGPFLFGAVLYAGLMLAIRLIA